MYNDLKILDKVEDINLSYGEINPLDIAKETGIIPLGFNEIVEASIDMPVFINSIEDGEFVAFGGISKEATVYNKENVFIPTFLKTYPFLNVMAKDEKDNLNSVIAVDKNEKYVSKNKKNKIFKDKELSEDASKKISLVRGLNRSRDIVRGFVKELKDNNLLVKKDFKVILNKKENTILKEFYVVDREKLNKVDEKVLSLWAKKGWVTLIDMHLRSMKNFENILKK